jgi:hypothetical protein
MKKKSYITPDIKKIAIDNIISLQMESTVNNLPIRTDGSKSPSQSPPSDPFASPFSDKPFN